MHACLGSILDLLTENGVHRDVDGVTITSPVLMWLEAIDLCFQKLMDLVDLSKIVAISGCAQQHGTVYWNNEYAECFKNLQNGKNLISGLKKAFSLYDSPIWMDSSTTDECQAMETNVGGPMELAKITGSKAHHRFSGNQIMKIFRNNRSVYNSTERISLVSSFLASVLCGKLAEIDVGDAGGMNLMDLQCKEWNEKCLNAIINGNNEDKQILKKKLGNITPSNSILGPISPYFFKYGFSPNCQIVTFTGDNLSSLAGLCLSSGQLAISLGTSDTVFFTTHYYLPHLDGHIFRNPINETEFMVMLCFKNGSFTRDRIRKSVGASNWQDFSALISSVPPGNNGNIGFYFDDDEILPNISRGDHRFSRMQSVEKFPPEVEARAVIEHQCLAKRFYAEQIGYKANGRGNILVTGGASCNFSILQILANVFSTKVYTTDNSDSAALGGALRARHGYIFFLIYRKLNQSSSINFHE
ncbi:unnamed protein product [Dracunculus medinensis]|uniref:Xylulose kinase n=1 Tax=Dracunculus medinensis TaxID=318479 RepID=A0A0N4U1Q8_DRAME|nr:unnamed protein product [Dracunculus medinensis]